ncbi:hypothetical protein ACLMPP_17500 [Yersinia enterocolitica]|uniref:hypothetical protein n=1 Tax=Yersinia enterocolitica TaxID=630 RepID=UPI00398D15E4
MNNIEIPNWFSDSSDLIKEYIKSVMIPDDFILDEETKKQKNIITETAKQDDDDVECGYRDEVAEGTYSCDFAYFLEKYEQFFPDRVIDYSNIYDAMWETESEEIDLFHEFLYRASHELCRRTAVSQNLYAPLAFEIILHILQRRYDEGLVLYRVLLSPIFYSFEKASFASTLGKTGGRPSHPHKDEAIKIAGSLIEKKMNGGIDSITSKVFQNLESKYSDNPSLATVKRWIKPLL